MVASIVWQCNVRTIPDMAAITCFSVSLSLISRSPALNAAKSGPQQLLSSASYSSLTSVKRSRSACTNRFGTEFRESIRVKNSKRSAFCFEKAAKKVASQLGPRVIVRMSATGAWPNEASAEKQVLVPVGHGVEEMEAVVVVDVLRRAGAHVTVASVEDTRQVEASRRVQIVADVAIADVARQKFDLVVLPGGMPGAERLRDSAALRRITEQHAQEGRPYAAICAAPAVALQSWGLLEGKQATAHPAFVSQLADPSAAENRVVEDGAVITSRGPGTAFEFALALVERLYGKEKAEAVRGPMVMRKDDGTDIPRQDYGVTPVSAAASLEGPPKVLVPVGHGVEEMEAVVVVDVLRRAGAHVTVASVEGTRQVEASRRVQIVADVAIADVARQKFDLVVLPGGMPGAERLRDCAELAVLLREQAAAQRLLAAICAAPAVVLQAQGLLEGKKATAHPAFSGQLPDQTAVEARVVSDGLVTTSRGPGTAMEFALVLVERLFGTEKAAEVAAPMVLAPAQLPVKV